MLKIDNNTTIDGLSSPTPEYSEDILSKFHLEKGEVAVSSELSRDDRWHLKSTWRDKLNDRQKRISECGVMKFSEDEDQSAVYALQDDHLTIGIPYTVSVEKPFGFLPDYKSTSMVCFNLDLIDAESGSSSINWKTPRTFGIKYLRERGELQAHIQGKFRVLETSSVGLIASDAWLKMKVLHELLRGSHSTEAA
uniref:Uncharacterized protein n=1 Tax=Kwoniella bestiolae CBS 10118 TaxID=1296100 RepID=A0A1B9GFL1_9TREE|nr:hypothetical protein I302_01350 [Kwoniella bestiolae CBS 10118]OCF29837.1 hypothetical protein I302_01350 [Kwoniella bestiolae CBS 10118]